MTTRTRAGVCAFLLLLALAFRLALATTLPNDEPDDAHGYTLLARNVLLHGEYSLSPVPPFEPTYARVPGYPLLIGAVYGVFGINNDTAVRVLQAVIETATCWTVACLALALIPVAWPQTRRRRVQCAALALAAVCPFTAIYVTTVLTEVVAIALGTAIAWFVMRALREDAAEGHGDSPRRRRAWRWWIAAGLAGGALTIVRPEGGLLTAGAGATVALVAVWRARPRHDSPARAMAWLLRSGALLALGFLVFDGPWIARNLSVFGIFQPIAPPGAAMPADFTTPGYVRWVMTWIDEPKYVGPFLFDLNRARLSIDQLPPAAIETPEERRSVVELFSQYNGGEPHQPAATGAATGAPAGMSRELDARFDALARDRIRRHPIRYYVSLPAERVFWMWAGTHAQYYPFDGDLFPLADLNREMGQHIWLPLFALLTLGWTVAGTAGAIRLLWDPSSRVGLVLLAMLVVPRLVLLGAIASPEPRYLVQVFPYLSALGGVGIGSLWSRLADRGGRTSPRAV